MIVRVEDVNIRQVVQVLTNDGMIVYPTETVYGLGVDATNLKAVEKLTKYKNRPLGKPYSIAVADQEMAEAYVELNPTAIGLYKKFLPGPMTIISKGRHRVAAGIESETGGLGIRISSYKLVNKIVKALGRPITATSANKSYGKRPYKISDLDLDKFDLVIDAGELPKNEPSTVVDTTADDAITLRQGDIVISSELMVHSRSEEETRNIGKELWQKYEKFFGQKTIVFALEGPMGVGKTQFTKGLAKAMGIEETITSPTFSLEEQYGKLHHIDVWRIKDVFELEALGLTEMITGRSVVVIEWADRVHELIRNHAADTVIIWVKFNYGLENERVIGWTNL